MGFGHRVYKNFDPRAKIIRECATSAVAPRPERQPVVRAGAALEEIALKDEYFIARKLYPNVDFYSA